jgi:glycosyltransferase involved in cell wall biosynthesis
MHITVGTQGIGYVEARLLHTALPPDVTFTRTYDAVGALAFVQRRLLSPPSATSLTNCLHWDMGINRVDLHHFVNIISCGRSPWVVSFEHYLPRWDPRSVRGMRLLAGPACRRLLALSNFARTAQLSLVDPDSALRDAITPKIEVIHPPQRLLISSLEEKKCPEDALQCTFVGRDFFRKGGKEILEAFHQLRSEGERVRMHIISSIGWGDYVSGSTADDARIAEEQMRAQTDWIIHDRELPNEQVLQALVNSHIALLPTYDDTYGFSALEAQAAGTPVVSTNVCAMSEINSAETGWVIPLGLNEHGQAHLRTPEERRAVSRTIVEGIYAAVKSSLREPGLVRTRAEQALERIRTRHALEHYAARLRSVYEQALHKPN